MESGFTHELKNGVEYLTIPSFTDTGVVKGLFSTRRGGVSKGELRGLNLGFNRSDERENVEKNFDLVAGILGTDKSRFVLSAQTHTDNIASVTREDAGAGIVKRGFENIDGLVTDRKGITLVTFYADCVPLFFLDPKRKVIGLAHSGWKGTEKRIGQKMVEKMVREYGCNPYNILAAIGPSAGPCCYEVSDDVAMRLLRTGNSGDCLQYNRETKKLHADLWRINYNILIDANIPDENITVAGECTICNPSLYYSARVQGDARGSLAAFLSLKDEREMSW